MLEDLDYYCVDNIPGRLLETLIRELGHSGPKFELLAVGLDTRPEPEDIHRVAGLVEALRAGRIAGADLQFAQPPRADSPLWEMDNLILSQYSANSKEETERAVALKVLD